MESALKIDMHQAKKPVKRMIAKIPIIIQKTLFYTDEKQPSGMFKLGRDPSGPLQLSNNILVNKKLNKP